MNDLKVFNHSDFGELDILVIDGKEYFPATACAKMLGYVNPKDAIKRHCRWGVKHDLPHPQNPEKVITMNFIPEGDLYRLIVGSKLPEAEKFERWIFDTVVPSIRRQGAYIPDMTEIMIQTVKVTVSEVMKQVIPLFTEIMNIRPARSAHVEQPVRPVCTPEEVAYEPQRCKLETFPEEIREMVDEKLTEMADSQNINFSLISRMCTMNGYLISSPAVKTYFKRRFCRD